MQTSTPPFRLPRWLEILLGVVILLELIAPFLNRSLGSDGPRLTAWIGSYRDLLEQGVALPHWIPSGFSGFGAPSFYFYPPLTFFLGAGLSIVTGLRDLHLIFEMAGILFTLLSFSTAWFLLRKLETTRYQTLLGAAIYAFAPFRFAEVHSRSALSAHLGYVFLPLLALGIIEIFRNRGKGPMGAVIVAIGLGGILLSNVPLSLVTMLVLLITACAEWRALTPAKAGWSALGIALAFGLAAFHYSGILAYRSSAQVEVVVHDPDFIILDLFHLRDIPAIYHEALIYFATIAALLVVFRLKRSRAWTLEERTLLRTWLWVAAFVAFLQIPIITLPLWRHVLILGVIQGTWRFFIYIVLFSAILIGTARTPIARKAATAIVCLWTIGAVLPVLLAIYNVHLYHHETPTGGEPPEYIPVYSLHAGPAFDSMLTNHVNDPHVLPMGFLGKDEYIHAQTIGPVEEHYEILLHSTRSMTFHRFYWPAWRLYVNDRPIRSWPDSIGRAQAQLPAGKYEATWKIETSSLEMYGKGLSIAALTCIVVILGVSMARKRVT